MVGLSLSKPKHRRLKLLSLKGFVFALDSPEQGLFSYENFTESVEWQQQQVTTETGLVTWQKHATTANVTIATLWESSGLLVASFASPNTTLFQPSWWVDVGINYL